MKLTSKQLRQIIKEELQQALSEIDDDGNEISDESSPDNSPDNSNDNGVDSVDHDAEWSVPPETGPSISIVIRDLQSAGPEAMVRDVYHMPEGTGEYSAGVLVQKLLDVREEHGDIAVIGVRDEGGYYMPSPIDDLDDWRFWESDAEVEDDLEVVTRDIVLDDLTNRGFSEEEIEQDLASGYLHGELTGPAVIIVRVYA